MVFGPKEAEAYLASLEPLGMRFGLERMRKLVTALGLPQHRFGSIHVVGTNGKSSVTEMTGALLEAHGHRTGLYLSPHAERWTERVRVGGQEVAAASFARAVEHVAHAVEGVNASLEEGDAVTQFEAATAAAFDVLAAARVEIAVIEAGLGGRLDATNVLPSKLTVLTSIGLEHTQWLGDTELEIAAEKLAVLREHTTLVHGPLSAEVAELARRTAAERHARLVTVGDGDGGVASREEATVTGAARAPFLRRNFAVAVAAAEAAIGPLDPERVSSVARGLELHGRMEVLPGDPPRVLDAAHNPAGAAALAQAIPEVAAGRAVVACVAVLADKDARGMLEALAGVLEAVVATEIPARRLERGGRPGARSLSAVDLAAAARESGVGVVEAIADPAEALVHARRLARERDGLLLVCGSHYLLGYAEAG